MPVFKILFINFSDNSQVEPNELGFVVKDSLVYESKLGFSIKQFTKIYRFYLI